MYDYCIIGGGVIGCAIARELTRFKASVVLVEAAPDVCLGASGANSGIIHSGYDAKNRTLKAKYNLMGCNMFRAYAAMLEVPYKKTGSITVATDAEECEILNELLKRGIKNNVQGLEILDYEQLRKIEPQLSRLVVKGLYAPTAAIIDPFNLVYALRENSEENGCEYVFNFNVVGANVSSESVLISSEDGRAVRAKHVINCAGNFGGEVARILGHPVVLQHRAGEYMVYDLPNPVNLPIFGVPSSKGKGILVTPTTHGKMLLGPTAIDCSKTYNKVRKECFSELLNSAEKLIDSVPYTEHIRSYMGMRAIYKDDFYIKTINNVTHVIGICSPGLTSAPAIAVTLVNGFNLERKADFKAYRRKIRQINTLGLEKINALISKNRAYGNIVCKCENISEAEIVEAIKRGARTVDGVKKRVGAGMGACQGGFCESKVIEILARELKIPESEVLKNVAGSRILTEGKLL